MKLRLFKAVAATLALSAAFVVSARSATLDTPTLNVVKASRATIKLSIVAGESGAPSGFTIEYMTLSDYEAIGGWPAFGTFGGLHRNIFNGTPTLNTTDGTSTFLLTPLEDAGTEIGDLFDETGVAGESGELSLGTTYVARVKANGGVTASASAFSLNLFAPTLSSPSTNCTYTQGYWKNHPGLWPVSSLTLGTVTYTSAQLLQIFNQPAAGNGLLSLAHQLIAAKLNIAQGAVPPAGVSTAIASADALISNKVCPPIGAGYLSPGSTSGLTNTLDDFNNGVTGPGHCGSVPARMSTWGELKSIYR